ncbi:transglutaminase-like domain-containing protein [Alkaliphilus peptidifermentans]|uniref:Transglutaminase-like superfamily protein n=1 Tax=Alkaliphilus peptidifermentans DSM 18978 TaxID=1120976 RepID=A0A1G5ALM6_9FIRM|nr:transglutaminase-like domain-containing protein [Alkaliphilus peptidifermentans]SCX78793.1 Transglutaminase-like superfamily protein [Alkaliphilus peptidifermentans DSM 18978]
MRKILSIILISILVISATVLPYGLDSQISILEDSVDMGTVGIYFNGNIESRVRLLVEKDGTRYSYNLYENDDVQIFPLQMGNGSYTVRVMENTEGNKYKTLLSKEINVNLDDYTVTYLNSIQEINWSSTDNAILKANELTKGMNNDADKLEAIYEYVVNNIKYDYDKVSNLTVFYLPDIDETLESGQGICYDYASLLAAMLRGVGVPTKMVKGYSDLIPNEYHAWNEVLINGQWKTIDTTYDAAYVQNNKNVDMYKLASEYNGEKIY